MKKGKLLSLLLIPALLLTGCKEDGEFVEVKKQITNKYSEQVQEYNLLLDKYKLVTKYYFVLDYSKEYEVNRQTYHEYEIGDYYTMTEYVFRS